MAPQATIIVPLYIYPLPDAWRPLYEAIVAHPHQRFIVIVNPNSGPGDSEYPDDEYTVQIKKLNAYANVQTVGYVRTDYGKRPIDDVLGDVDKYAFWTWKTPELAMHGIFFDESPHWYETQHEYAEAGRFVKTINQAVKSARGILSDKMIIHNPGCIPHDQLADPLTDVTVVFEQSYQEHQTLEKLLRALPQDRSRYCLMIHSIPADVMNSSLPNFVAEMSRRAQYIFLTDLTSNFYESFSPRWKETTDVIQRAPLLASMTGYGPPPRSPSPYHREQYPPRSPQPYQQQFQQQPYPPRSPQPYQQQFQRAPSPYQQSFAHSPAAYQQQFAQPYQQPFQSYQ